MTSGSKCWFSMNKSKNSHVCCKQTALFMWTQFLMCFLCFSRTVQPTRVSTEMYKCVLVHLRYFICLFCDHFHINLCKCYVSFIDCTGAFVLNIHTGSHDINLSEYFHCFRVNHQVELWSRYRAFCYRCVCVCVWGLRRDVSCSFKLSWELSCWVKAFMINETTLQLIRLHFF